MDKISFFSAVCCDNKVNSKGLILLENVDSYFYLGGKKVKIMSGHTKGNAEGVCLVDSESSLTALKIASYFTVIIPLIMLVAKIILRLNYDFYLIYREKKTISDLSLNPPTTIKLEDRAENSNTSKINMDSLVGQDSRIEDESSKQALKIQEKAALAIQCAWRSHMAQSKLQTLKNEKLEQQRIESLLKSQSSKIEERSKPKFSAYSVKLFFSGGRNEVISIHNEDDIESMVKKINEEIYQKHTSISVYFEEGYTSDLKRKERMEFFQKAASATNLQFTMRANCSFLRVKAKPIAIEELGNGETRRTFANGITETFRVQDNDYIEARVFPDGKREKGLFDEKGDLYSGYRLGTDKQIEYCNPAALVSIQGNSEKYSLLICEIEEKLVVLEKRLEKLYDKYMPSDVPIHEVLVKACARGKSKYDNGNSINKILLNKKFENQLNQFIEFALGIDESGKPRLFGFSNDAIIDVLEAGSKIKGIDPLKIIDPESKRNIFLQAANWGSTKLLKKLTELFPDAFEAISQEVVAQFLLSGNGLMDEDKLSLLDFQNIKIRKTSFYYDFLEKAKLDTFHSMWLQVAKRDKPDLNFKKEFALLSSEQQKTLYDAAFTYNNPFLHEPSDPPITPDQYSINLMWINKNKIPKDQEFLFGNGSTFEERESDFHNKFVKPVSKWARRNPGSPINIWIDSEMASPEAIERSRAALQTSLEGTSHGIIQFRDVRSMDVVRSNPQAFSEKISVYFRVDLLRAIAADYTLRQKETQFFVYGDIDMKPLSAKELFDKRTVNFLNDFGFVMAKGGHLGFENGFQILNGHNPRLMDSHRKVIIDLSVEMALERTNVIKEQQIYDTYPAMITHFLDADGRYGKLKHKSKEPSDMLKCFRFDRFGLAAHGNLPLGNGEVELSKIMPRKPVRLPPSHF